MTPAMGSMVWTASSEAFVDELDLHLGASHLIDPSVSPTGGAIVLDIALVKPESRGTLRLASRDPNEAPVIDLNYLRPTVTPVASWRESGSPGRSRTTMCSHQCRPGN